MNLCVLTIRDGRDEIHERSIESLQASLPEPEHHVIVDDHEHKLGFAGAIGEGWRQVTESGADWVFHHEADFIFNAPVPVEAMAEVLAAYPYLAQLALKRQPWNGEERDAGGIVECWPEEYRQRTYMGHLFSEHRLFWTTNPSLYPAAWCRYGWPQSSRSEEAWTKRLCEDPDLRFAFWGGKHDPPLCEHIGTERAGKGY